MNYGVPSKFHRIQCPAASLTETTISASPSTMKPPAKPKVGSFQAMGLSQDVFRGVSDGRAKVVGKSFQNASSLYGRTREFEGGPGSAAPWGARFRR